MAAALRPSFSVPMTGIIETKGNPQMLKITVT